MTELINHIKEKNAKISWNSNFMIKYVELVEEKVIELGLDSKGEYIYYLYKDGDISNSICICGKKKNFQHNKEPYRRFCSTKCSANNMTEETKNKISNSVLKYISSVSEETKKERLEKFSLSYKENWNSEKSNKRSDKTKEMHALMSDEDKKNRASKISNSLKTSAKAKEQRIERGKLGAKALKDKISILTEEELEKFKKKMYKTSYITPNNRPLFEKYRKLVWYYTKQEVHNIADIDLRGKDYHLDHKFSVIEGFKENISPEIIGNNCNLEIIRATDNCSKQGKCSITKEELMSSFEKSKFGDLI